MKKITWYSSHDTTKELYFSDGNGWLHYSKHPLKKPDYPIAGGSKGYATMQHLMKLGYQMVQPSEVK